MVRLLRITHTDTARYGKGTLEMTTNANARVPAVELVDGWTSDQADAGYRGAFKYRKG